MSDDTPNIAGSFAHARRSAMALPNVVSRLRQEIEAAGFLVLHEIDTQAILSAAGHAIGAARQILFFHPGLMVRLLEAEPAALVEAPLKFAVLAMPDGSVGIRWLDPVPAFGRYGNDVLAELGRELAVVCDSVAARALETTDRRSF